jgi:4-amino-4-deoxy-L-arabinose transferase-like glycosyltransferase
VSPSRAFWALLLGVALLRGLLIGAVGLGDDEAYYAIWARQPALGYFDHPPAVAWLIHGAVGALGEGSFAVRLPTLLCGLGAAVLLARAPWAGSQGRGAAVLFLLCPLFALLGLFTAPDAPALLCLLLSAAFAWAGLQEQRGAWLLCGIFAGLGLLCKHPMGLWGLSLFGLVWTEGAARRRVEPYLGAALALAIFLPNLFWNADQGWASVQFHLDGRHGGPRPLQGLGTLVGSQLAFLTPPLLFALLLGLRQTWQGRRSAGEEGLRSRFVLWSALPTLGLFSMSALLGDFKPHWLAPGWLLLLPAAAAVLDARPRLRLAAWGLGGALQLFVFGQAVGPLLPLGKADLTHDLYGWPAVAAAIRAQPGDFFVAGHMSQTAAQLAWALPERTVTRLGGRPDQFDLWRHRQPIEAGMDAIFVSHDRYDNDPARLGRFATCAPLPSVEVERGGAVVRVFRLWRCQGYQP